MPFIGRDKIALVVNYEVESLLPFSLEDAIIDFIITHQDFIKNKSKILIAAVRKEDIAAYINLFEKAELKLDYATTDIFALYELYQGLFKPKNIADSSKSLFSINMQSLPIIKLWKKAQAKITKKSIEVHHPNPEQFKPKNTQLFVDLGFDVVRVLYFQDYQLTAVRMIPLGIGDIAQQISQSNGMAYDHSIQSITTLQHLDTIQEPLTKELNSFFEEINRTLHFFDKQNKNYTSPEKILFSGILTSYKLFQDQAQSFFSMNVEILKPSTIVHHLHIASKHTPEHISVLNFSLALFEHFNQFVNFLKNLIPDKDNSLLNKQILSIILITTASFGLIFWKSITELESKQTAYNSSNHNLYKQFKTVCTLIFFKKKM